MKKNSIKVFLYLGIIVIGILLDQGSKIFIKNNMELYETIPVIKDVFHITYIENNGAAFNILSEATYILIGLPIIITAVILLYLFYYGSKNSLLENLGLLMIVSGGLGNLVDRANTGQVIDFLDFRIWPVFNIADIFVSVGCIIIIVAVIFSREENV